MKALRGSKASRRIQAVFSALILLGVLETSAPRYSRSSSRSSVTVQA